MKATASTHTTHTSRTGHWVRVLYLLTANLKAPTKTTGYHKVMRCGRLLPGCSEYSLQSKTGLATTATGLQRLPLRVSIYVNSSTTTVIPSACVSSSRPRDLAWSSPEWM